MATPDPEALSDTQSRSRLWLLALAAILIPWLSQPPLALWPLAFIAVIPYLAAAQLESFSRRDGMIFYAAAFGYWALTMQGLRFAHPAMYACWLALAAYLAIYPILFVVALRRAMGLGVPCFIAAPLLWVGIEWLRNYILTGISAVMLGHALADVPVLIQIADLGGSYAVSLLVVLVNAALFAMVDWARKRNGTGRTSFPVAAVATAFLLLIGALVYGRFRLQQPTATSPTTFALIGRDEPVEYNQEPSRELELFDAYARQSLEAIESNEEVIDAVVWPESMFTGTLPMLLGDGSEAFARQQGFSIVELRSLLDDRRRAFTSRADSLQGMLAKANGADSQRPDIIAGCGVVDYGETPRVYSGMVHLSDGGKLAQWYGKTHLVMFGEYIPLVQGIPMVRSWVPEGMGLTIGDGPRLFRVDEVTLSPNICIETAVERVAVNHLRTLRRRDSMPNAIVTVTNDGWFDDSAIVQHHKRCAQFVAVACRRPVLSAANNGPTAWIDSRGVIVEELPQGSEGAVIAKPRIDSRTSAVIMLADWPAAFCGVLTVLCLLAGFRKRR
jgi:apolipoprotein N-acyltransferase